LKNNVNNELMTLSGKLKRRDKNKDSGQGGACVLVEKDKQFLEQIQKKRNEKAEERRKIEEQFQEEQERRRKQREEIKKLLHDK